MKQGNGPVRCALWMSLALMPLLHMPANAQQIPGIQVAKISTNPTNLGTTNITDLLDNPTFFTDALKSAWRANKSRIDQQIQTVIGANQANYGKVTLYNQKSSLSDNPDIHVQFTGGSIVLTTILKTNVLTLKSTTPTVLGKWADPALALTYDLTLTAVVPIPTLTQSIRATKATVSLTNASIDSQNFPADLALALGSVIKFFGGPDFKAQAENAINRSLDITNPVNSALGTVNTTLLGLAQQGYTKLGMAVNPRSQRLTLQASPPGVNVSAVVSRLVDNVNVAPQYRSLVTSYVRIRMLDGTYVDDNSSSSKFLDRSFSRGMLSDVPGVPVRIEVYRYIDPKYRVDGLPNLNGGVTLGAGGTETLKIAAALAGVKVGLIRTVDMNYSVKTHSFSGGASGVGGRMAVIPHGGPDAPEVDFALGDDLQAAQHSYLQHGFSTIR